MKAKLCVLAGAVLGIERLSKIHAEDGSQKKFKSDIELENLLKVEKVSSLGANDKSARLRQEEKLKAMISETRQLCWLKKTESSAPGMVIAVSVDGKMVYRDGELISNCKFYTVRCLENNKTLHCRVWIC